MGKGDPFYRKFLTDAVEISLEVFEPTDKIYQALTGCVEEEVVLGENMNIGVCSGFIRKMVEEKRFEIKSPIVIPESVFRYEPVPRVPDK